MVPTNVCSAEISLEISCEVGIGLFVAFTSDVPHCGQNIACGAKEVLHCGQVFGRGVGATV